jgi:integrase
MRARGEGRIFKDKYRDKTTGEWRTCETWTIRWYAGGRHHKLGGFPTEATARRELRAKQEASAQGLYVHGADRTTFEDLARLLLNEYRANGRRSLDRAEDAVGHLHGFFDGYRAQAITPERVLVYVRHRQEAKAANATINRELAALKRMFRLGERAGKVARRPAIDLLQEHNVRVGFFEEPEFYAVIGHLPEDLRPVFEIAYITGWRVKSEILSREWAHVDFRSGWLRLEPGETKNREGRMFPLTPKLRAVLEHQRERTDAVAKATGRIVPWVFHRGGQPIRNCRRAWLTGCLKAGLAILVSEKPRVIRPQRIPHDFRRTAIRNLERSGVSRSAAMKMVGHKTESIYRRYAIVNEADLKAAGEKLERLHRTESAPRMVLGFHEAAGRVSADNSGRVRPE